MEWENKVICVHNFVEIQALFNHTYFSWTSWRTGRYGLPCHFLSKSGLIMGSIVARLHPASLRQLITFVLLGWVLNTKWFFSLDGNIFLSNSDVIVLIWKRGSICLLIWPCVIKQPVPRGVGWRQREVVLSNTQGLPRDRRLLKVSHVPRMEWVCKDEGLVCLYQKEVRC